MHDGDKQQADRLGEVDQLLGGGVAEHLLWIAQVGIDDRGVVVPGQDGLAVSDDDRVDIGIDHPGAGIGLLGDLV